MQPFATMHHQHYITFEKPRKPKNMNRIIISSLAILLITLSGCRDKVLITRQANSPIFQELTDWRASSFDFESSRDLNKPGKIYIYQDYLFVMEPMEGIHFIDNSNPADPSNMGFLPIYACADISIKDDFMYVDSYFDILVFDVSDKTNPTLAHRVKDVIEFDNYTALPGINEGYPIAAITEIDKVIVGWEVKEVTSQEFFFDDPFISNTFMMADASVETTGGSSTGTGGSQAQFTISNDYLYTLKSDVLAAYQISIDGSLIAGASITINRDTETLFPYNNHLFMGTTTGMVIYSLTDPSTPEYIGHIDHVQSCDPVVVDGNRAYVTLSTSVNCWGTNQLDVINLDNYASPSIIQSYWFTNPQGLGLDGSTLFLCDGDDGLKVFDRSDDNAIQGNQIAAFPSIHAYDVIPSNGVLLMTGDDGIYQYDYSDITSINQISLIPITNI